MSLALPLFEQGQRNRIPVRDVSRVIDVQVVATVAGWQYLRAVVGVAHRLVEIHHAIELTAAVESSCR